MFNTGVINQTLDQYVTNTRASMLRRTADLLRVCKWILKKVYNSWIFLKQHFEFVYFLWRDLYFLGLTLIYLPRFFLSQKKSEVLHSFMALYNIK